MKKVLKIFMMLGFVFSIVHNVNAQKVNIKSQKMIQKNEIIFPRPFAVAIDDMGWMLGNDDGYGDLQGPYRLGIHRHMDVDDYKGIVEVGKKMHIRFQGLFVLGEMDRLNILGKVPTTNPQGKNWDNSQNISDEQIKIMNYLKENAANLEFGLHGVLHEYWPEVNKRRRAEWYDLDDHHPWPEKQLIAHVEIFKKIMAEYGMTKKAGYSFPESFVPTAYGIYWNPKGNYSTCSVLHKAGVKYADTQFYPWISELNPPKGPNAGGIDHGVLVINRNNYGNPWYAYSSVPTVPIKDQKSDIIESHWTNWIASGEFLQKATNQKWLNYLRMVQRQKNRYLAKNTEQFYAQWLYKKYTTVSEEKFGTVKINNARMPDDVYKNNLLSDMVLKVILSKGQHISSASINNKEIAAYYEDEGYGFIYLPTLKQKKYVLKYSIGTEMMPQYVYNDGTYNVYSFRYDKKKAFINLRIYGQQVVKIVGIASPSKIRISNSSVTLITKNYDNATKTLSLTLKAHDIEGETTTINFLWGDTAQVLANQGKEIPRGDGTFLSVPDAGFKAYNVLLPMLGWSSWSFIRKHPTAAKIKTQALALKKSGLEEIGYKYVNIDDFWYETSGKQGPNVGPYGRWVTDSSKFPAHKNTNGIKVVADYIHSLGLKFGIYVTPGISMQAVRKNTPIKGTPYTADQIAEPSVRENNYNSGGMVGINFNKRGAQAFINSWVDMFAKWGVDYIKLDGITNSNTADIKAWSKAIQQSGRPMIFDVTQGSYTKAIALTLMKYANQWEFAPDIEAYGIEKNGNSYPLTSWANVENRFNYVAEWQPYAGPEGYNDYDAIEIGNGSNDGLTPDESKTQLSLWALASSPLILGVDLTHLNRQELQKYLKNTAVLVVDQDGIAAKRLVNTRSWQVFAKMEPNGDAIVGLFNIGRKAEKISIQVSTLGFPENKKGYSLDNLWTGRMKKIDGTTISATVPSHGVVLYRVRGL